MKQLLILNRDLSIKQIIIVNDVIPVRDIVSPQKTTFEIQKNDKVVLGDLIVLKRENDVEYIGVVQDLETQDTTKIASYPLINITDMDFSITNIKGSVFNWIKETFTKNFVETQDTLLKLPLTFEDKSENINLNYTAEDGNLFDVLLTLFKKYGIYLSFSLDYENGKIVSIVVIVNRASETNQIVIRYDNPIIFEKPNVEKSQAQDTNKIIFKPDANNKTHKDTINYYLLDNNTVTKDANAEGRINGVVQAIETYTDKDYDSLQTKAESLLVGDVLNHQITLKVLKNASYDFDLYSKVKFIDKDKTYDTYVTRIENFNDKYTVIKLGILRFSLTDKIKALQKAVENGTGVRTSSSSGGGGISIAVIDNLTSESSVDALSAKQGKVLNEKIVAIPSAIDNLTSTSATSPLSANQGRILDNKITEIKFENTGNGLPLGAIIPATCELSDASLHLLNGEKILQTGIYEQFATWLKAKKNANPLSVPTYDTDAEFDSDVATYGQCGRFVIDDTAGTIRLPKITKFIEGLSNNTSDIGKAIKAGLPNITGNVGSVIETEMSGAFSNGGNFGFVNAGTSYQVSVSLFNANNGSSVKGIYGNSNTVQPDAIKYPYYIVVATGVKTPVEVDIDKVVTDLNKIQSEIENIKNIVKRFNAFGVLNTTGVTIKGFVEYIRLSSNKGILNISLKMPTNSNTSIFENCNLNQIGKLLGISFKINNYYISGQWVMPTSSEPISFGQACEINVDGRVCVGRYYTENGDFGGWPQSYHSNEMINITNLYVEEN